MLDIGKEIGIPAEIVSDREANKGKFIKYVVDRYDYITEEYELSNSISSIFLPKDVVEKECRIKDKTCS